MKHLKMQFLIAIAAVAAGMFSLQANTVAWYHFNEGENATLMRGGQPSVLNAVAPLSLPGTPYSINSSCVLDSANFMPRYIDEVRVSKGVLSVDQMLHVVKRGSVMLIR